MLQIGMDACLRSKAPTHQGEIIVEYLKYLRREALSAASLFIIRINTPLSQCAIKDAIGDFEVSDRDGQT